MAEWTGIIGSHSQINTGELHTQIQWVSLTGLLISAGLVEGRSPPRASCTSSREHKSWHAY